LHHWGDEQFSPLQTPGHVELERGGKKGCFRFSLVSKIDSHCARLASGSRRAPPLADVQVTHPAGKRPSHCCDPQLNARAQLIRRPHRRPPPQPLRGLLLLSRRPDARPGIQYNPRPLLCTIQRYVSRILLPGGRAWLASAPPSPPPPRPWETAEIMIVFEELSSARTHLCGPLHSKSNLFDLARSLARSPASSSSSFFSPLLRSLNVLRRDLARGKCTQARPHARTPGKDGSNNSAAKLDVTLERFVSPPNVLKPRCPGSQALFVHTINR